MGSQVLKISNFAVMKHRDLIVILVICLFQSAPVFPKAQTPYVKQIVAANSGKFEFSPPYQDYVNVQSYIPVTGAVNLVQTVFTQSVQDIVIKGNVAYIAAQDSLIMMNLTTYQRVAAIADSGLSKMLVFGDKLVVTKQYPVSTFFAEVLRLDDLSPVASIQGIPGDCGGLVAAGDSIYIAVNGGWMGTEGKIAVVETAGWTVSRIINLGASAIGIMNIYKYNKQLFTVNKSPFSAPDAGSLSVINLNDNTFENFNLGRNVSTGAGIDGHLLYFGFNYGIGSFNLNLLKMEDSTVVSDPGSAMFKYITSATVDTLNHRIYVNVGDYVAPGTCLVATLNGDSVASFATGISTDGVAVDYRVSATGVENLDEDVFSFSLYPNPAADFVTLKYSHPGDIREIRLTDMMGRNLSVNLKKNSDGETVLNVGQLPSGMYAVTFVAMNRSFTGKFLRK
jgi:hypothetical protein